MTDQKHPGAYRDPLAAIRDRVADRIEQGWFRHSILALIVLNGITLGFETSPAIMAAAGDWLHLFDRVVMTVFVVEILLRLFARGTRFFRDPWSVFDFLIVAIALSPTGEGFTVLRALRILRALRLVSAVPRMRRVVGALLHAVPGIGAVAALLLLIFYVFAVVATNLFGAAFPAWFGTIGESMYSLFQIMTLESWSMGIVRPVMEQYPYAWAFFVPFIIICSFAVLNLFIAIIVDSMQTLAEEERAETVEDVTDATHADAAALSAEISHLRDEIRELRVSVERGKG